MELMYCVYTISEIDVRKGSRLTEAQMPLRHLEQMGLEVRYIAKRRLVQCSPAPCRATPLS
jgi:hypothetical protein